MSPTAGTARADPDTRATTTRDDIAERSISPLRNSWRKSINHPGLVNEDNGPVKLDGTDDVQGQRTIELGKERNALTKRNREYHEPKFVDQSSCDQVLGKGCAAVGSKILSWLHLQGGDLGSKIAG